MCEVVCEIIIILCCVNYGLIMRLREIGCYFHGTENDPGLLIDDLTYLAGHGQ